MAASNAKPAAQDKHAEGLAEPGAFVFEPASCPLCDAEQHTERYVIDRFKQGTLRYVNCAGCGTAYQNPRPDQESMRRFYHSTSFYSSRESGGALVGYRDYDADEVIRIRNAQRRLREIEGLFEPGKRIRLLKVACGYGTLVKLMRDKGHPAEGLDFSEVMAARAKERYGIGLINDDFLTHDFGAKRYDVIGLFGAINNFLNPVDVARRVHELLEPGGFYIVNHMWLSSLPEKFQGRNYWIYRPPIVAVYPRQAFREYHCRLGFEVHRARYDVQFATLSKALGFLHFNRLTAAVEGAGIGGWGVTLPLPGYEKVFFKKKA